MALPFAAMAQNNADNTLQPVTVKAEKTAPAVRATSVDANTLQQSRSASSDISSL